jgi:hypothetical protein
MEADFPPMIRFCRKTSVLLLLCFIAVSIHASELFVAPAGSDSNDGTARSPFATITYASTMARPGDTVRIKAGVYSEHVRIGTSGAAGLPVSYVAEAGAIVDGSNITLSDGDGDGLFLVSGQSHVIVDGITIRNTNHHGITVSAGNDSNNVSDITIRNCVTRNTDGAGIIVYGTYPFVKYQLSNVLVEDNDVIAPQQGRFNGNNRWHEDITVGGGVENFIIRGNHVDAMKTDEWNGGPLGIDAKDGVRNGKIYNNHVENIPSQGIYVDGGKDGAYNIEIYQNRVHDIFGYGIIVGAEEAGRVDNIKIYNNIVYDTGWSGVLVDDYLRVAGPPQEKTGIHIFNNTLQSTGFKDTWTGGIQAASGTSGKVFNNIIDTDNPLAVAQGNYVVTHNCIHGDRSETGETGSNVVEGSPEFIDAANADFHLQAGSPCIDAGISAAAPGTDFDGNLRPSGNAHDAGAYEFTQSASALLNLPANQWYQLSLPAEPPGNAQTVKAVFGDDLSGNYGSDWIVYAYDPGNNAYVDVGLNSKLSQGVGYWIIQKSGSTATIDMPTGSSRTPVEAANRCAGNTSCYRLPLVTRSGSRQWNLSGHPLANSVTLDRTRVVSSASSGPCATGCTLAQASSANILQNRLWHFDGAVYQQLSGNALLAPWAGFWVAALGAADAGLRLEIPVQ